MGRHSGAAIWGVAVVAVILLSAQAALADSACLTVRYILALGVVVAAAAAVMGLERRRPRAVNGPEPEPVSLVLALGAALSVWAPAWWLMDATDYVLDKRVGVLALPTAITRLSDRLLGVNLNASSYELGILFAVVLLPLAEGWLLWGLFQPEVAALAGRRRAVWIVGGAGGLFMALTAVQNVAPALPWGLASVPGYLVLGLVAARVVSLTGSPWAGFAAHSGFAYASFAWRDDLFRQFAGKEYWDPAWLTVIVLGVLGAAICMQAIRYRAGTPAFAADHTTDRQRVRPLTVWLAVVLLAAALSVLIALDLNGRHGETRAADSASRSITSGA